MEMGPPREPIYPSFWNSLTDLAKRHSESFKGKTHAEHVHVLHYRYQYRIEMVYQGGHDESKNVVREFSKHKHLQKILLP